MKSLFKLKTRKFLSSAKINYDILSVYGPSNVPVALNLMANNVVTKPLLAACGKFSYVLNCFDVIVTRNFWRISFAVYDAVSMHSLAFYDRSWLAEERAARNGKVKLRKLAPQCVCNM